MEIKRATWKNGRRRGAQDLRTRKCSEHTQVIFSASEL
jgi:hypothetical protein